MQHWGFLCRATLALLGSYGIVAVFWSVARRTIQAGVPSILLSALAALAVMAVAWSQRDRLESWLREAGAKTTAIPWPRWLALVLILALAARLIWYLIFPVEPLSDSRVYLFLAGDLLDGMYGVPGEKAYYPPGYPLGLVPMVAVFGESKLAAVAHGLLLTVFFVAFVGAISRRVLSEGSARLAVLVVCLWPGFVTIPGASKDYQAIVLIAGAAYCYLRIAHGEFGAARQRVFGCALCCGLLIGAAGLTQPGTLLMVGVVAIAWAIVLRNLARTGLAVAASLIGVLVVVAPWTIRNYVLFDDFVAISTNLGSVLYRANHDLGNGGYIPLVTPYQDVEEAEQSRLLARDAVAWIVENPGKFARLAVLKQLNFLGDHGDGIYYTVRREPIVSTVTFAAMRVALLLFSLALYAILVVRLATGRSSAAPAFTLFVTGAWVYLLLIDSIFEGGGRHFFPVIPFVICLAVGVARPPSGAPLAAAGAGPK